MVNNGEAGFLWFPAVAAAVAVAVVLPRQCFVQLAQTQRAA